MQIKPNTGIVVFAKKAIKRNSAIFIPEEKLPTQYVVVASAHERFPVETIMIPNAKEAVKATIGETEYFFIHGDHILATIE